MSVNQGQCLRLEFTQHLNEILKPERFKDYCPNGLQVEGKAEIRKIVSGVTASVALINAAIEAKADAIVVHHGYFFRGEDERIIGQKRQRIGLLIAHNINLYAYHLPLDAHPTLGNNAQLGRQLGLPITGVFGDPARGAALGVFSDLVRPIRADSLANLISNKLARIPAMVGPQDIEITRVAWCTGAAQDMLQDAIDAGAQAFISGEISERTTHLAQELGCAYFSAGHHATERYGVQAVCEQLAQQLRLVHEFIDIDNPV